MTATLNAPTERRETSFVSPSGNLLTHLEHANSASPVVSYSAPQPNCRVETMFVHPEMAADWLNRFSYGKQRKVRSQQVDRLTDAMNRGIFLGCTDISFTQVAFGGDWKQTDGQHRLHAIVKSGKPQWLVVKWYDAEVENERANIYGGTDRGLPRSTRDNLIAHELYSDIGLTKTQVSYLQAGVRVLAGGFTRTASMYSIADDLLMEGMRRYKGEASQFFRAIAGGDSGLTSRLCSSPTLAVALLTFRYQPDLAEDFWSRIAANSGLRLGEPEHSAVRLLTKYTVKMLGVPKYSRSIGAAWNARVEGRSIVTLPSNPAKPIRLLGTSYSGRENRFYLPDTELELVEAHA